MLFAAELVHFFALMLWTAALLAWIAGLVSLAISIAGVVVLNAMFSFVQERRADRAAERLRVLLPSEIRVRRDGRVTAVDVSEVVVGDVVVLEAGDRIPADGTVSSTETLSVDTSMLTGESGSVPLGTSDPAYAGTFVVDGSADAAVTATGSHTRLATTAELTSTGKRPPTPLTHSSTTPGPDSSRPSIDADTPGSRVIRCQAPDDASSVAVTQFTRSTMSVRAWRSTNGSACRCTRSQP